MLVQFLALIGVGFLIWMLYRGIRGNPESFSRDNLSKSFTTLGILGLLLIGVVWLAVILLR